nr:BON domain-containing protein [Methylonatrum kenyense]
MLPAQALLLFVALALAAGCAPSRVDEVRDDRETADGSRNFADSIDDQRLRGRIIGHILNDRELQDRSHINVTVFNGVVLLTGEVRSREPGRGLARFAESQDGVQRVHNELVVADLSSVMARSRDNVMQSSARTRIRMLREPEGFDHRRVVVRAERRRLYLLGSVTREEADAITESVRRISGVREVVRLFDYRD